MVVSLPGALARTVEDALESLTSQVALALESAALTEDLLIQQSQARFASLVKNSSDLVMLIEPDTTVTYASPSAERVLGIPAAELEGTRFADLVPTEDRGARPDVPDHDGRGRGAHRPHRVPRGAPRRLDAHGRDAPHEPAARPEREGDRAQHP